MDVLLGARRRRAKRSLERALKPQLTCFFVANIMLKDKARHRTRETLCRAGVQLQIIALASQ